ncbi:MULTISPECIES: thioredoxin domain-containing protein [Streptomyces]|uniref:Thioredoxin domain-containing protein n=1 Tax=Streptomyces koelreuteriae TaxID=2838015 RepID=A0ABX8FN55_9ACTN|nr:MULTISPECIES: thioredoxin domain-containing protein [Streptomyces]QWB22548.1 thioredoxin domain-containing protein [Streptomyces koelreuteriae]UUA05495.1 DsbA family protein [Streptomyces koelreuteriae]UUA13121.1 DsbA family protein [Streptomyces sp. CRCS-T-1]
MKKLYKHLIVAAVLAAGFAAALGSYLLLRPDDRGSAGADVRPVAEALPVRASSHRLSEPERSELTIVEFLDFECEACGAYYPVVERLREEYGDRVTFVARYFPMPGHRNAEPAARAAEAAARQGAFEAMYTKLFTTQKEWGESQEWKAPVFRGYAEELGLNMKKFDADFADPETAGRVQADQRDGLGLGVQGTPTFLIDGTRIQPPASYKEFKALIEDRLGD